MNDADAELVTAENPKWGGIIGPTIIGKRDPRTLSETDFTQSDELLFHGAAREFNYSPVGQYDLQDTGGDGSTDYGMGLYTTDSRTQAENYSRVRAQGQLDEPIVYPFLPSAANMLDVRSETDQSINGALPNEFVQQWTDYLTQYVDDDANFVDLSEGFARFLREGIREDFLEPTVQQLAEGQAFLIRTDGKAPGIFQRIKNGLIDIPFRDFMRSQGFDGMIYREGGEGEDAEPLTGYVFYNYDVVDTQDGWQQRSQEAT